MTRLSVTLAAAAGFGLAALFGAGDAVAQIKIGAVLSVTGPASFLGDPEKKTLEMYVADINAKGGINGEQIRLFVYDDGSDPNQARTFAIRLIEQDKVDALLAGSTTATTMPIIGFAEDAQIPLINFAGAVQAVHPVKKWNFKTPHTDLMACEKIFEDLKKRNLTKVALISGADAFGKSMRDQCMTVTSKYGIEVLHEETYQPRDSDMTPQLDQHQGQGRLAGGDQSRLRPGPGDRDAQLPPARHRRAALSRPRHRHEAVHRARDARPPPRACALPAAALLVADKLPDNDPQKKVVVDYKQTYESQDRATGLDLRRPHVRRADDPGRGDATRQEHRQGQGARRDREDQRLRRHRRRGQHVAEPITWVSTSPAFRMLEISGGDWTLAQ